MIDLDSLLATLNSIILLLIDSENFHDDGVEFKNRLEAFYETLCDQSDAGLILNSTVEEVFEFKKEIEAYFRNKLGMVG